MSNLPQYYKLLNVAPNATKDQIRTAYKKESLKTHPDRLPPTATPTQRKQSTEKFQAVADAYYVLSDPARRREYDLIYRSRGGGGSGGGAGAGAGASQGRSSGGNTGFGAGGGARSSAGTNPFPGGFPDFSSFGFGGSSSTPKQEPYSDNDDDDDDDESYDPSSQPSASSAFFATFGDFLRNATGAAGSSTNDNNEKEKKKEEEKRRKEDEEEYGLGSGSGGGRPDAQSTFGNVFEDMLAPEVAHVRPWWSYMGGASGAVMGYIVANVPGAVAGAVAGNRLGAIRDAKGKSVAQVFGQLGASQKAEILKTLAFKVLGSMT